MCMGFPMQVLVANEFRARCRDGEGFADIDLSLVGPVCVGDWLLVFCGAAREVLAPERAAAIRSALALLEATLHGEHGDKFSGIEDVPRLPSHLQAAFEAGKREA